MLIKMQMRETRIKTLQVGQHFFYPVAENKTDMREYILSAIGYGNTKPLVRIVDNITERAAVCPANIGGAYVIHFFDTELPCLVED